MLARAPVPVGRALVVPVARVREDRAVLAAHRVAPVVRARRRARAVPRAPICRVVRVAGTIRASRSRVPVCVPVVLAVPVVPAAARAVPVVAVPVAPVAAVPAAVVARRARSASPRASVVGRSRSSPPRR